MSGTKRMRIAATAALAILLGAACDDAPTADGEAVAADSAAIATRPDGAPAADGCAIVDEAAAERAVGFDVTMNDNSTGNCVLTPADGNPAAPAFDVRIEPRVAAFDYFSAQPDATPIAGLGDRAVWATLNDMTGYVVVVTGSRAIVTAIAEADGLGLASRRQTEALARTILAADRAD